MGWRQVAVQLEAHELVTATMKRTGSDDFGPGNWSEPLEVLCTALRREADLDLAGRRWARAYLLDLLSTRAERAAGGPRAGAQRATPDPVIAATPDQLDRWTPDAAPDDDDELAVTLCSIRFEQWWHVPGYAEWLDGADLTDAYGQWAAGPRAGRGGVLHLEHLPLLRRVLGDTAVLVRTGDLDAATEAMVADVTARRTEANSGSDVDQLRRYWRWRLGRMLERTAEGASDSG